MVGGARLRHISLSTEGFICSVREPLGLALCPSPLSDVNSNSSQRQATAMDALCNPECPASA